MATDIQAVRQAAERWRDVGNEHLIRDGNVMCDYILEAIPADAAEPITAEWLREEWGIINDPDADDPDMFLICHDIDTCYILRRGWLSGEVYRWRLFLDEVEQSEWPLPLENRREVSTLLTALGIQRKRKDGAA